MPLKKRKLSRETCEDYGYRVRKNSKGEWEHLAPYWGDDGELLGIHVRNTGTDGNKKEFYWAPGSKVKKIGLFGSRTWEKSGKMFVITAGQIDAMTVSQAFGNNYSVASLPGGDLSTKAVAKELERIKNFEKVVLWVDNDGKESSAQALVELVRILPPGKCHVVETHHKDANEMLLSGASYADISRLCWGAKEYRPDGLVDIRDLREDLLKEPVKGTSWGKNLEFMDEWTYGRRGGQIIFLGGGTGSGKTVLLDQIICNTVLPPVAEGLGVFSWERDAKEMGRAIIGKYAEKLFHIPQDPDAPDDCRDWTRNDLIEAIDRFYDEATTLIINDSYGAAEWDVVKDRMRAMVHTDNVRHIILDPITALAASLDERNQVQQLDRLIADAALTTRELDVTTIAVSHLATPSDGKSHEEGGRVRSNQFRGSRSIMFWATGMFGWERDQQSSDESERLIGTLRCLKDRYTGRATGKTKELVYDLETGIYSPKDFSCIGPAVDIERGEDIA
jgi:twinkle protein